MKHSSAIAALESEHFAVVVTNREILKQNSPGHLPKLSKFVRLPS